VARPLAQQVKQHIFDIAAVELFAMWSLWSFKTGESPPKTRHCTLLFLIHFTIRFTVCTKLVAPTPCNVRSPAAKVTEAPRATPSRATPPPPATDALHGAFDDGARHGSGQEIFPGFAALERAERPERPKRSKQPEEAAKRITCRRPVPVACVAAPPSVGEH
jgi:hypothetical protein